MRKMVSGRSCPKCKGNMFTDQEDGIWYVWCLQCGQRIYLGHGKFTELETEFDRVVSLETIFSKDTVLPIGLDLKVTYDLEDSLNEETDEDDFEIGDTQVYLN